MSTTIKSFFDRQKRDLSDKSNEDDERKKARESSLNISLSKDDTDIFEEGIESPRCAGILYSCLQNLEKKVNEIFELSSSTKEAQIKGARHLEEVNESIKFINEKFEEMEADRKEKEQQISELKIEVKSLNEKVETMDRSLDCHEQYSRRNCLLIHCLLIHGVKENEKEDTDEVVITFFEKEMKEKLSANDTDRSHRLGKKQTGRRPRPIIIKFARYNVRNIIFRKKKILKGKAVSITENLTKKRITEMKVARETYGFKKVWSQDGKILHTDANDRNKIKVFYD